VRAEAGSRLFVRASMSTKPKPQDEAASNARRYLPSAGHSPEPTPGGIVYCAGSAEAEA
jgi:hypothetical protein